MTLFRSPRAYCLLLGSLVMLLGLSCVVALGFGPARLDSGLVGRIVLQRLFGVAAEPGAWSAGQEHIVWLIRAPRVLLGAVLVVLYIGEVIGLLTLPLAAFLGALGSMLLVLGVASRGGRLGSDRLLLAGVAVSFVLLALANLLLFLGDHRAASSVLFWMLGGLGLARWSLIWLPALCVAGGLLVLLGLGRALNALMAGEQTAVTLGLDARRVRLWVFVCCSLLTGVLVSVSGAIGFVGLMLPHAARLLVGAEHRRLLPVCALLGALFLVWMDVAARTLIAPQDLPIGIATAAIGGLFFILLLRRRS
ncbi:iron ABC transporter permease [Pseudomonas aeruginosa]|uniref:FecCD family ABC transporter permease n=1 Tax=Pseudomonas aeruginosa TaxID=287 RepID=UPI000F844525|nr:iron ABC transporter permease [Pseudomonas aeruginosa]RTW26051.1 iron ABC transporter permease [Pseudomonas aeruginosa]